MADSGTVNTRFRDAMKRIWLGLAAQSTSKTAGQVKTEIWEEMAAVGLLRAAQEANPLDYYTKGHVPPDWKIVRYLAELGYRRAMLRDSQNPRQPPWLREFLSAAGYSQAVIQAVMDELKGEQTELEKGVLHNLPQHDPARFFGRHEELAALRLLLSPEHQAWVITIDGSGGVGKTELVLALGDGYVQNLANVPHNERFQAVIWLSAKQSVLTAGGIIPRGKWSETLSDVYVAIARTLGRQDILEADEAVREDLVHDALTRQRTLLIIDNVETVRDETLFSFIRDVRRPTKVIVTTRHRIDVAYEMRLTGLSRADARQLMADQAAQKGVTLTAADSERLYDLTGGVPLAIIWTIGKIAFGLTPAAALQVLTQPGADINRFCLESDIELIATHDAYPLLLALALCAQDADRGALGAATGLEDDVPRRDQALSDLEILSLVNLDPQTDRFSLLPLTRYYLQPRLDGAPDTRRRLFAGLVEYYKRLFEADASTRHARYWQGLTRVDLSGVLEQEWVNVREALRQLHQAGAHRDLLTLGLPLVHLLNYLGPWPERLDLCRWMAASARALDDAVEAWLLVDGLGWILLREGRYDELLDVLNAGRHLADGRGGLELASILADTHEAYVYIRQGKLSRARQLVTSVEARLARHEAAVGVDPIRNIVASRAADRLVRLYQAEGDLRRARELNRESLSLKQAIGEDLASTHYNIAFLSLELNDLAAARDSFLQAMGYPYHRKYVALSRYGLAQVAEREGNRDEAQRQGRLAAAQLVQLGLDSWAREADALVERLE